MSRKRNRNEFSGEENDDNILKSKKKCVDKAKSMDFNADENKIGDLKANNNKIKSMTVSQSELCSSF